MLSDFSTNGFHGISKKRYLNILYVAAKKLPMWGKSCTEMLHQKRSCPEIRKADGQNNVVLQATVKSPNELMIWLCAGHLDLMVNIMVLHSGVTALCTSLIAFRGSSSDQSTTQLHGEAHTLTCIWATYPIKLHSPRPIGTFSYPAWKGV